MTLLNVVYFKDGGIVEKYTEADSARIAEYGGKRRTGELRIFNHSHRGILPESTEKVGIRYVKDEDLDKLFNGDNKKEASLTASQKEG